MASAVEEGVEYESDPEEATRSLAMRRRREASDDEDGGGDGRDDAADRRLTHSDDSEGGVAEYDDVEEELEEEEEEDEEEEEEELEEEEEERVEEEVGAMNGTVVKNSDADVKSPLEEEAENGGDEEEKKENEPFAVPTAGAFYMHDDRFRDNAGARQRRMRGGRRLWESKDERKWGHDKFEEISFQDRHYKEGRRPKGNFRGRGGKTRGVNRIGGYVRGNRKGYDNRVNQTTQAPKSVVRGRGPRRYEPTNKNNDSESQVQYKQTGRQQEKTSHASSGKTFTTVSNSEPDSVPTKKQVFASNLNYASPPFYPSSSSTKDINVAPKGDIQTGGTSRNVRPGVVDEGFILQQNNALRGKNVVDHVSLEKLYIDGPSAPPVGKAFNNFHIPPPGSSAVNASQSIHPRGHGRGGPVPVQMNYQPVASHNHVGKIDPAQLQAIQRTAPGRASNSAQSPAPQLGHRPGSGSQASSSPPKTSAGISSVDSGEIDSASESGKLKGALVGKGRGASQGSGRGSFVYSGAMGTGGNHGDQNFPAFLPVMQFGGQHPGGIGVPAVGMAFPGYVAQPQLGMGNSEMTWLPVLTGAAGALGATGAMGAAGALGASYCPPYLTVDGAYHARQSGQASATATSSKENNNANKGNNEWKQPQKAEPVSDEFGQRQNKPRRYSEMNFGQ